MIKPYETNKNQPGQIRSLLFNARMNCAMHTCPTSFLLGKKPSAYSEDSDNHSATMIALFCWRVLFPPILKVNPICISMS